MGSQCYVPPEQVNEPHLDSSQASWYSIHLIWRDGSLELTLALLIPRLPRWFTCSQTVTHKGKTIKVWYLLQRFLHEYATRSAFTISEVAADWHGLRIPQRNMRPSIACISEQLDPQVAASRHTTAPISHSRPSPRSP